MSMLINKLVKRLHQRVTVWLKVEHFYWSMIFDRHSFWEVLGRLIDRGCWRGRAALTSVTRRCYGASLNHHGQA